MKKIIAIVALCVSSLAIGMSVEYRNNTDIHVDLYPVPSAQGCAHYPERVQLWANGKVRVDYDCFLSQIDGKIVMKTALAKFGSEAKNKSVRSLKIDADQNVYKRRPLYVITLNKSTSDKNEYVMNMTLETT